MMPKLHNNSHSRDRIRQQSIRQHTTEFNENSRENTGDLNGDNKVDTCDMGIAARPLEAIQATKDGTLTLM
jgi:hypothetical protein